MTDFREYRFFPLLQELRRMSEEEDDYVLEWAYQVLKMAYTTVMEDPDARGGLAKEIGLSYNHLVVQEKEYAMLMLMQLEHQRSPESTRNSLAKLVVQRLQKSSPSSFAWSEREFMKVYKEHIAGWTKDGGEYTLPGPDSIYRYEEHGQEAIDSLIRLYPNSKHRKEP